MSATGDAIAAKAREGVTASWATGVPGWCSQFVRQVVEAAGISRGTNFGGTAIETASDFRRNGLSYSLSQLGGAAGLQAGDILFQEAGSPDKNGRAQGHTAIYLGGGQVAEDTTVGAGGKRISALASWGTITSVGRLGSDAASSTASSAKKTGADWLTQGLANFSAVLAEPGIPITIGGATQNAINSSTSIQAGNPVEAGQDAADSPWDSLALKLPQLGITAAGALGGALLVALGIYLLGSSIAGDAPNTSGEGAL